MHENKNLKPLLKWCTTHTKRLWTFNPLFTTPPLLIFRGWKVLVPAHFNVHPALWNRDKHFLIGFMKQATTARHTAKRRIISRYIHLKFVTGK